MVVVRFPNFQLELQFSLQVEVLLVCFLETVSLGCLRLSLQEALFGCEIENGNVILSDVSDKKNFTAFLILK